MFHGGSSLRKVFKKNKKFSKIQKLPKTFPNCSKVFWTCFGVPFSENFLPSVPWRSSLRNVFKKSRNFQNSKNAQNRSQKCPHVFLTCFGVIFPNNFFAQCSMEGRDFELFLKKVKKFQNSKNAQKRSQIVRKCFERVLGTFFGNFFLPSVPWRVESSKCFQKIKNFSKN